MWYLYRNYIIFSRPRRIIRKTQRKHSIRDVPIKSLSMFFVSFENVLFREVVLLPRHRNNSYQNPLPLFRRTVTLRFTRSNGKRRSERQKLIGVCRVVSKRSDSNPKQFEVSQTRRWNDSDQKIDSRHSNTSATVCLTSLSVYI